MVGGVAALAGALVLGPRIGKFSKTGKPNAIPGHDIPMAILGTMILAFGWFGFNAGSTLAGNDLRIGVVAVNTMLASAAGAMASLLYMYVLTRKWDPTMTGEIKSAHTSIAIFGNKGLTNSGREFLKLINKYQDNIIYVLNAVDLFNEWT